jgi:hypothetical protein
MGRGNQGSGSGATSAAELTIHEGEMRQSKAADIGTALMDAVVGQLSSVETAVSTMTVLIRAAAPDLMRTCDGRTPK